jgi:aflatoxin B1 aldehyde reductase
LSNFSVAQVQEAHSYCKSKGYVLPTVYQAMYSLVARKNELALFPALRELGMSIQAYSPVAAGFLLKSQDDITQGKGRWDPSTLYGKLLNRNYNRPSLLQYLQDFTHLANSTGISQAELAYRWVRYNSALRGDLGDSVIIGATKSSQLEETLRGLERGPLEDSIVEKLETMWKQIEADAPDDNYVALMGLISEGVVVF